MLRYMLDTSILIHTIKNKPAMVHLQFEAHDLEICASSVTAMELLYRAHKSQYVRRNLDVIEALLDRICVVEFDLAAADHAGQIRAAHEAGGTPIGAYDVMISGHARARGLCLVTNNKPAFACVDGLRVEDWAA